MTMSRAQQIAALLERAARKWRQASRTADPVRRARLEAEAAQLRARAAKLQAGAR